MGEWGRWRNGVPVVDQFPQALNMLYSYHALEVKKEKKKAKRSHHKK